jgi:hypothetical protein
MKKLFQILLKAPKYVRIILQVVSWVGDSIKYFPNISSGVEKWKKEADNEPQNKVREVQEIKETD